MGPDQTLNRVALAFALIAFLVYRFILSHALQRDDGNRVGRSQEIPPSHGWGLALGFATCALSALVSPGLTLSQLPGANPLITGGLIGTAFCAPAAVPTLFLYGVYGLPLLRAAGFVLQIQLAALIAAICFGPPVAVALMVLAR